VIHICQYLDTEDKKGRQQKCGNVNKAISGCNNSLPCTICRFHPRRVRRTEYPWSMFNRDIIRQTLSFYQVYFVMFSRCSFNGRVRLQPSPRCLENLKRLPALRRWKSKDCSFLIMAAASCSYPVPNLVSVVAYQKQKIRQSWTNTTLRSR
jgi:hypothetical protein